MVVRGVQNSNRFMERRGVFLLLQFLQFSGILVPHGENIGYISVTLPPLKGPLFFGNRMGASKIKD